MQAIYKKVGVEIELMAPIGSSRLHYAEAAANFFSGQIQPYFHIDTEPSKVRGKPFFFHITQAYEVVDAKGLSFLKCVDDITLQADLDKSAKPKAGWFRIVSDDLRLLRLIRRHSDASASVEEVLKPIGELFGTAPKQSTGGVSRLLDESGASIALAAPLPGERERACEIITSPLLPNQLSQLEVLLKIASELQFTRPKEGATHLHFDGELFSNARMFRKTVNFLHANRLLLKALLGSNPYCRRVAAWKPELLKLVNQTDFVELDWSEAIKRLKTLNISKYHDFNLRNLILQPPSKHTFEIRILPSTLSAKPILLAIDLFNAIFQHLSELDDYPMRDEIPVTKEAVSAFKKQYAVFGR